MTMLCMEKNCPNNIKISLHARESNIICTIMQNIKAIHLLFIFIAIFADCKLCKTFNNRTKLDFTHHNERVRQSSR